MLPDRVLWRHFDVITILAWEVFCFFLEISLFFLEIHWYWEISCYLYWKIVRWAILPTIGCLLWPPGNWWPGGSLGHWCQVFLWSAQIKVGKSCKTETHNFFPLSSLSGKSGRVGKVSIFRVGVGDSLNDLKINAGWRVEIKTHISYTSAPKNDSILRCTKLDLDRKT